MTSGPSPRRAAPAARPAGFRLGRVLGVPVYLRASWLLLAAIVVVLYGPVAASMLPQLSPVGAYSLAVAFVLFLLLSVLLHELGHAIVARRYRIGVRAITLELLGGYTEMESDSPNARADLWVSVVGPAVSGVIGAVSYVVWTVLPDRTILDQLAFQLAWSNLIVAVFNALPGLPLDGGRALRALVWAVTGDRNTGGRIAGWIGRGVAVATLAGGLALTSLRGLSVFSLVFLVLVAMTLWQGASASIAQARMGARLPLVNLRQLARPLYLVAVGTPLAEANRRAAEAGFRDAALGVVDSEGRLVALVHEQAAAAVPHERRPWVPVDSVARSLEPGRRLAVDLSGEDVIRAVQADPAPSYLVVADGEVVGVLRTTDLARLLNS